MAFIAPFRGVRYNPAKIERLEDVVTPPYDVIDEKKQKAYKGLDAHSMISLDICKDPGQGDSSASRYQMATDHFVSWQKEGVLIQDAEPAVYLYYIDYTQPSGRRMTRKGLVSLVRLAEFSEGIVKPHEETFASVTSDRFKLMNATRAQFSQIFSIFHDAGGEIIAALESARGDKPLSSVRDADGVDHTIWEITDKDALAKAQELFQEKTIYIADGHHRYTTALNFRRRVVEQNGEIDDNNPYNFTMMYLCPAEDPGLAVLTPHRLVRLPADVFSPTTPLDKLIERFANGFFMEEICGGARETLLAELQHRMQEESHRLPGCGTVLGLYHAGADRCFLMTLKKETLQGKILERKAAIRDLDVAVLTDYVFGHLLGLHEERCENENLVRFFSEVNEALDVAVKESVELEDSTPLLFLMGNVQVQQVVRVADEGLVMPHKSTFFYPKVVTGLLIHKFAEPVRDE